MALSNIYQELKGTDTKPEASIPARWTNASLMGKRKMSYSGFLADQISGILGSGTKAKKQENWSNLAIVYNIFVRYFTAYDHDQDGLLGGATRDTTLNSQGLRETGTFLKTIALLPYLKALGVNTIHLLPITDIGIDGRKGDLGSPYAIKNPLRIDPLLADPVIPSSAEEQFAALVEAAHRLEMRVVQEFIFRTASIDSDWVDAHPEWFYWLKETKGYGPPEFPENDLKQIKLVPKGKGRYLPPPATYRDLFALPPAGKPEKLKIASAFADWPPDDLQPPWTDVTYLRLFNYDYSADNNFNYIAYNTIRYYDPRLAKPENRNEGLWQTISDIIPHYQKKFGIDGAMIDMGHALPDDLKKMIIRKARENDPHFAFWDENFENTIGTKNEGYNVVIGGSWYNITKRNGFKKEILSINKKRPLPYFGTAETHNSPRYGFHDKNKKIAAWLLFNLLPQAIPFLHNGFELYESLPVNTGLNFTKDDLKRLKDARLPLFYKNSLNWDTKSSIIPWILKIQDLRIHRPWVFDKKDIAPLVSGNPKVIGFIKKHTQGMVIALFNINFHQKEKFNIAHPDTERWIDLLDGRTYDLESGCDIAAGKFILALGQ
jgi:glycosidase